MDRLGVLRLYRNLLKHSLTYPSMKRESIIQSIRVDFRQNAALTDPAKISKELGHAQQGLKELQKYSNLAAAGSGKEWNIHLSGSEPGKNSGEK